jgi:MFS family permease
VLIGIGSALAAFGAFLALTVALAPPPDEERVGRSEHYRRLRIATVTTIFAGAIGFTGAALVITTAWPWSLVAIGGATVLYLVCVIISTLRTQRFLVRWIKFERDTDRTTAAGPGRILASTAALMNLAPWEAYEATGWYGAADDPASLRVADHVQRVAEERARLSWVLRHPFGGGRTPRDLIRTWILLLRYRLEMRRHRSDGADPGATPERRNPD